MDRRASLATRSTRVYRWQMETRRSHRQCITATLSFTRRRTTPPPPAWQLISLISMFEILPPHHVSSRPPARLIHHQELPTIIGLLYTPSSSASGRGHSEQSNRSSPPVPSLQSLIRSTPPQARTSADPEEHTPDCRTHHHQPRISHSPPLIRGFHNIGVYDVIPRKAGPGSFPARSGDIPVLEAATQPAFVAPLPLPNPLSRAPSPEHRTIARPLRRCSSFRHPQHLAGSRSRGRPPADRLS